MDSLETVEEITFTNLRPEEEEEVMLSGGGGGHSQTAEATQITSAEQEEKRRFVIRAVVDPRTKVHRVYYPLLTLHGYALPGIHSPVKWNPQSINMLFSIPYITC